MSKLSIESSRWRLFHIILVGVLSLWGFAKHNFQANEPSVFQKIIIETVSPIQRGTMSLKESITYFVDHYFLLVNTSKENIELEKKISNLENKLNSLEEVAKENIRLKELMDFGKEIPKKKILAQVVGWDASSSFKVLRVNKGSNQGIKEFAPVVTTTGLVGYVYQLSPNYSDILTILDPNNRVDTIVSRTRSNGVLEGRSNFRCSLKYIARTEKLENGDKIITAGMGNIYPKGILVGEISKIDKKSYGITQKIEVKPYVDFKKLEEVVILIDPKEKEKR